MRCSCCCAGGARVPTHPSRRPLRGLLRMRKLNCPHGEERREGAASRTTRRPLRGLLRVRSKKNPHGEEPAKPASRTTRRALQALLRVRSKKNPHGEEPAKPASRTTRRALQALLTMRSKKNLTLRRPRSGRLEGSFFLLTLRSARNARLEGRVGKRHGDARLPLHPPLQRRQLLCRHHPRHAGAPRRRAQCGALLRATTQRHDRRARPL